MPKHPGGRPPIWNTDKIAQKVSEIQSVWWTQIEKMMTSKNPGERKFALAEFNKLQVKAMPQALTGEGGGPVQINLVSYEPHGTPQLPSPSVSTTPTAGA